jgi:hypothetical protein
MPLWPAFGFGFRNSVSVTHAAGAGCADGSFLAKGILFQFEKPSATSAPGWPKKKTRRIASAGFLLCRAALGINGAADF